MSVRYGRCHICGRQCVREVEPAVGESRAALEPDRWTVALRNGLHVDACLSCWMKWPDAHKLFTELGFRKAPLDLPRVVAVLRETR